MTNMIHFLSFIEFPIEWPIRRSLVLCGGRNSILGTGQGGGGGRGGAGGGGGGGGGGGEGEYANLWETFVREGGRSQLQLLSKESFVDTLHQNLKCVYRLQASKPSSD